MKNKAQNTLKVRFAKIFIIVGKESLENDMNDFLSDFVAEV